MKQVYHRDAKMFTNPRLPRPNRPPVLDLSSQGRWLGPGRAAGLGPVIRTSPQPPALTTKPPAGPGSIKHCVPVLAICFPTVGDAVDNHATSMIFDGINDAVRICSKAIAVGISGQLFGLSRSRVARKRFDDFSDAEGVFLRETTKFAAGGGSVKDVVQRRQDLFKGRVDFRHGNELSGPVCLEIGDVFKVFGHTHESMEFTKRQLNSPSPPSRVDDVLGIQLHHDNSLLDSCSVLGAGKGSQVHVP